MQTARAPRHSAFTTSVPRLIGGVSPASGSSTTPFTFHHMTEADANDTTYTDGKEYAFTSALAKGVHTFLFRTTDTTSDAVQTATQTGPDNS
jgi:hypothetical protein